MKCKKHVTDYSSSVGVCASCLNERLFSLISAQTQAQVQAQAQARLQQHHSPLHQPHHSTWHHSLSDQQFYSTPQVDPTRSIKKKPKFSILSFILRSDHKNSDPDPDSSHRTSSSSSWFSTILSGERKKQSRTFSVDESTFSANSRVGRNPGRGMSPATDEGEHFYDVSSGYSSESYCRDWKQTPVRSTAPATAKRCRVRQGQNVSGLAFCLSPLVRASPNRQWNNQKVGVTAEMMVVSGAVKRPHLFNATSFCKNRSKKLADFGKFREVRY